MAFAIERGFSPVGLYPFVLFALPTLCRGFMIFMELILFENNLRSENDANYNI